MTKIVDFALSKARTTLALALLVIVAGSIARSSLGVAADPNIQLPLVSVSVFLDGASPEDASRRNTYIPPIPTYFVVFSHVTSKCQVRPLQVCKNESSKWGDRLVKGDRSVNGDSKILLKRPFISR